MSAEPASATAPPPAATTTTAPIPFRESSVASTGDVFGMFAITLLLLAAFAGAAWYARKAGWLDRWIGKLPAKPGIPVRRLTVVERLPLSRKTMVYRIVDGDRQYLLAESMGGVQWLPIDAPPEAAP
ncbi:hypothetical protein [Arenimonas sp.]|uniref:hypothetical protein n=1 Tax=Arenimonas sp. TaxID=1872635 RepID=UPI0039E71359